MSWPAEPKLLDKLFNKVYVSTWLEECIHLQTNRDRFEEAISRWDKL